MNESSNDLIIVNNTNAEVAENGTVGLLASGLADNFGGFTLCEDSVSHDQEIERNITERIGKEWDSAIVTVESLVYDAILTWMDNVVISRVEMAVRFITVLSGRGRNSVVLNLDQRDFSVNKKHSSHDGI